MNKRLDLLIRKNRGKKKLHACFDLMFDSGFKKDDLKFVDLEPSEIIRGKFTEIYNRKDFKSEIINGSTISYLSSNILAEFFSTRNINSESYIYSYDCQDCGMFIINSKTAIKNILSLTKKDYQNTTYLIDCLYFYLIQVTYYDHGNINSEQSTFEIQVWENS